MFNPEAVAALWPWQQMSSLSGIQFFKKRKKKGHSFPSNHFSSHIYHFTNKNDSALLKNRSKILLRTNQKCLFVHFQHHSRGLPTGRTTKEICLLVCVCVCFNICSISPQATFLRMTMSGEKEAWHIIANRSLNPSQQQQQQQQQYSLDFSPSNLIFPPFAAGDRGDPAVRCVWITGP